jgi:hypothetical protein
VNREHIAATVIAGANNLAPAALHRTCAGALDALLVTRPSAALGPVDASQADRKAMMTRAGMAGTLLHASTGVDCPAFINPAGCGSVSKKGALGMSNLIAGKWSRLWMVLSVFYELVA